MMKAVAAKLSSSSSFLSSSPWTPSESEGCIVLTEGAAHVTSTHHGLHVTHHILFVTCRRRTRPACSCRAS
jgi:hypothetical protein